LTWGARLASIIPIEEIMGELSAQETGGAGQKNGLPGEALALFS
jgi:hypothetical protein